MVKLKISNIINLKSFIHEKLLPDKKIKLALISNFPNADDIEWSFKNNTYEAAFTQEGVFKIASFDDNGELKEERTTIFEKQLPDNIKELLNIDYNMNLLVSATEITKIQNKILEIVLDSYDKSRYLLQFNDKGQLLKEQLLFAIKKDLFSSSKNQSSDKSE